MSPASATESILSGEIDLAAAVSSSFDTSLITITNNMDHTHGLSIYWPSYRPYDFTETYAAHDIPMLDTVQWDAFLQSYWGFA
jgi:hypothetical protein